MSRQYTLGKPSEASTGGWARKDVSGVSIYIYTYAVYSDGSFGQNYSLSVQDYFLNCIWQKTHFFPTCQVRVVRFYQSCSPPPPPHPPSPSPPPPPPPRSPDPSGHCRTSTASSRSQWALPDLNRELQIPVGTAGPQPRLPGRSGHCRTSTATSRSQWALPDLNRDFQIALGTAGPQPRLPGRSGHCRTSTATSRSQWALPDLNGKNVRKDVR